jgi:glycosyltransferase involved in cell wall biosynthesis
MRPLLFYSAWPLGYHNPEAERKAVGFAVGGFEVVYVAGVGIRNPRLSSLRKLSHHAAGKLHNRSGSRTISDVPGLSSSSLLVLPPRQLATARRLNTTWLERQVRRAVPRWEEAVAWVRWPTPELVDFLVRRPPATVVYECVDAYHHTPGVTGRWAAVHEQAERALVERAAAVVVPGEVLAERYRSWGADVRVIPHGVELFPWRDSRMRSGRPVIGFVGTLDYRIDVAVVRHIARCRPDWHLRFIGPVQEGFSSGVLADLANVTVEPPVPNGHLGEVLAGFSAGLMPYRSSLVYRAMTPVKTLELLAAGLPAVARRSPALEPYGDLLYLATTQEEFVTQLERALAEDSPQLARRRRDTAEANTWDHRLDELRALVAELLDGEPVTG